MDVAMPVLDGIQATRLLQREPGHAGNQGDRLHGEAESQRRHCGARLFEGVLEKPASPEAIVSLVQRYSTAAGPAGV